MATPVRQPGTFGIRWRTNTLLPKLTLFATAFEIGLREVVDELAQEIEEYAKENAPWSDRTGDAREGLTASARHRQTHYYIDLYHTVDYGIWLEIRWNGAFAIIQPTLEHYGPIVMSSLSFGGILTRGF